MGKRVTTHAGKVYDVDDIFANKSVPAIGNMNVNARGDLIDIYGNVIKTKDEIAREFHQDTQQSVSRSSLLDDIDDDDEIDFSKIQAQDKLASKTKPKPAEQKVEPKDNTSEQK